MERRGEGEERGRMRGRGKGGGTRRRDEEGQGVGMGRYQERRTRRRQEGGEEERRRILFLPLWINNLLSDAIGLLYSHPPSLLPLLPSNIDSPPSRCCVGTTLIKVELNIIPDVPDNAISLLGRVGQGDGARRWDKEEGKGGQTRKRDKGGTR